LSAILITGGAGFIGSTLAERLLERGESVVVLDDFCDRYAPALKRHNVSGLEQHDRGVLIEGDVRDLDTIVKTMDTHDVSRVVHLAAHAGVSPSLKDPFLYQDVNLNGTLSVLEACRRCGCQNLLVASSSSVYGDSSTPPFREDEAADHPISPYAATKRSVELMCYTYHHLYGLPITCFRFFTVYGPRQRPDMAFHIFARHISQDLPIRMYGDGSTRRDYTFISDIIDGLATAVDRPQDYEIVNLGNTKTVALATALDIVQSAFGKSAVIEAHPERPGDVKMTNADIEKARRLYGYEPRVDIEEGMQRFAEWYQDAVARGVLK
jgi:UDP-glucuronate 4-epimerase